jgi:hypothetical protein
MKITLFSDLHRNRGIVSLESILEEIKSGRYAASVNRIRESVAQGDMVKAGELKKELPAFTLSGEYEGSRKTPNLVHYNGLVMLDFDKLTPEVLEEAFAKAKALPHTICCFRSPSGNGLKVGVRPVLSHPLTIENHPLTYQAVAATYERELGILCDPSGKDIGRLCFVSYDPAIYIGLDKLDGDLPLMAPPSSTDTAKKLNSARKQTTRKMEYNVGNRNNYVFLFALNCAQKGVTTEETFNYCQKNFPDLTAEELRTTIQSASKTAGQNPQNTKPGLYKKKERLIWTQI